MEEKRTRLQAIFFEKVSALKIVSLYIMYLPLYILIISLSYYYLYIQKEFFQLKELESIAPKLKGISKSKDVSIRLLLVT